MSQLTDETVKRLITALERSEGRTPSEGFAGDFERGVSSSSTTRTRQTSAGASIAEKQLQGVFNAIANTSPAKQLQQMTAEFDRMADPKLVSRMNRLQRQLGGLAGAGGENFREGAGLANEMSSTLLRFNEELAGSVTTGNDAVRGLGVSLRSILGDASRTYGALEQLTLGADGSANAFRFMQNETDETMLRMGLFGQQMDLQSSQIATFMEREISMGVESGAMLEEAALAATRVAAVYGDSGKEIMNIIEGITKDTSRYGNVSVQEAAKIGGALRQLGLDYGELGGMTDKFFSFENAASSVSALTSVFGVQIDAMEAMRLANSPDRLDFLTYMREQFMASGKAVEDMTLAEKRLVQQQLGLSDIQAVERLFDPTVDLENLDAIEAAAEQGRGTMEDSIAELEKEIKNFGTATDSALGRVRDASSDAFTAGMQKDIMATIVTAEDLIGTLELVGQEGGRLLAEDPQFGFLQKGVSDLNEFTASFDEKISDMQQGIILAFTGDGTEQNPGIVGAMVTALSEALQELRKPPWKSESPSLVGLMLTSGIFAAFAELPQATTREFRKAGAEGTKAFTEQLEKMEGFDAIAALGKTASDLSKKELDELASHFEVSSDRMAAAIDATVKNKSERDRAQDLEARLRGIMSADTSTTTLESRLQSFAENNKISLESIRKYIEGSTQDEIFNEIMAKKAASEAKKEKKEDENKEEETKVEPTKSKEATATATKELEEARAAQRAAEREAVASRRKLTEALASGTIVVKVEHPDVIVNVDSKTVATAALDGFEAGATSTGGQPVKVVLSTA